LLAADGEKRRRIIDRRKPHGIGGFTERDISDAAARAGRKFALGIRPRRNTHKPRRAAATRELGQCVKRCARIAEPVKQHPEGARPDVVAADQTEPIDALLVGKTNLRAVAVDLCLRRSNVGDSLAF
jgi:hypothetical protein